MKGTALRRWGLPALIMVVVLTSLGFLAASSESDFYGKMDRGISVFGRVYKEIATNYVEEVDPEKFMEAGIDGMLSTLDPYTVYISREEGDEVDLLTNGKYGGIGVTIGVRDGAMRIMSVMDGYSAQRQGLIPGDVLLEVDGTPVASKKPDDVRSLTRGEPGTTVKVLIRREGAAKPIEFTLQREEIQLHNVTYSGYAAPGIGYVRLERFSRRAGDEMRQAIQELKVGAELDGLVLDLRGNPGGLLDAAVDVVSKFVPKGNLVVSTRGRSADSEKKYFSTDEPVLPAIPVVVLTDRGTASASEIVAGALQDLDRAVVLGTRTFGKGLVQTILPLNYGAQLKVTTARYYTPSGRCIQEIDYQHHDKNGVFSVTPDSLRRKYRTVHGRPVFERGGIQPDSVVTEEEEGPMVRDMIRNGIFFKFANTWVVRHGKETFTSVDDKVLAEFQEYLAKERFEYTEDSETKIRDLRKIADASHYNKAILEDLDRLSARVESEKKRGLERYKDHVVDELGQELSARAKGEKGRIEAAIRNDQQLKAAVGLLRNATVYRQKLAG